MQVHLTHHSATRKSLDLNVPVKDVNEAFSLVINKIAPQVRIPGFRPGKAPKSVLLSKYQQDILREVAENLVGRHFWNAAAAAGTAPISQPSIERAELQEGAEGKIKTVFDVAPEVQLGEYKNATLTKKKRTIDEEALTDQLASIREQRARFVPVEGAAVEGSYATLDIKVKPQGMKAQSFQDQVLQLSADRPFDAQIVGLKVEEAKSFFLDVPVDDPNRAMAGKKVSYEVVLKDLRTREVPELNDELAKDLGHENLEAFKAQVTKDLEEASERDAQARLQATLLDNLLDTTSFEAPASLVGLQLDDYCQEFANLASRQGVDPRRVNWGAYRQSRMVEAERAVRSGYLLQAIGNAENIEVSEEEIDAEIQSLMAEHGIQQAFDAFKTELAQRNVTTEIRGRLRTEKIFEALLATATITEELLDKAAYTELVEVERRREAGIPAARFDAGGLEGGELEAQEGGEPATIGAAEEAAPAEEAAEVTEAEAKPKKAPRKKKTEETEA